VKFYTISAVVRCHWCRQVRDGQSASARHIGRYCGQLMPPAITTTTRYLFVRFVSDAFDQRNGFSLDYVTNGWSACSFRVSRRRREMYCGHPRLCVSVSVCPVCVSDGAAYLHYCTHQDVTCESDKGCPLVVHYWADLQSGHGLGCCGSITRMQNVGEYILVLAVCLTDRQTDGIAVASTALAMRALRRAVKTVSGKVVVQSIAFRVVSIYWQEDDPFPLKSWLNLTYPLLIAASLDTFCLVAPQR